MKMSPLDNSVNFLPSRDEMGLSQDAQVGGEKTQVSRVKRSAPSDVTRLYLLGGDRVVGSLLVGGVVT